MQTDPGQAHLGPPATVAWAVPKPGPVLWESRWGRAITAGGSRGKAAAGGDGDAGWVELEVRGLGFVGATSPYSHLLAMLSATAWCFREARSHADRLVVDTSGLARGKLGTMLKKTKFDLLAPDAVVLLGDEPELLDLARWMKTRVGVQVLRFAAHPAAIRRTASARRRFRRARWQAYLADARSQVLRSGTVGLAELARLPRGTIVAGRDAGGRILGVARSEDPSQGVVTAHWDASQTS
jgi:polynucleotide 5'-kinase involved in rRNA processing